MTGQLTNSAMADAETQSNPEKSTEQFEFSDVIANEIQISF
jgi:hypothetical protein